MVHITKHMLDAFMDCCVGRRDDYALQRSDGRYYRVGCPLSYDVVFRHLEGVQTIGSYLLMRMASADLPSLIAMNRLA